MNKKASTIFISLGFLFLQNAIFGRYLILPGYLASLEQGQATVKSVEQQNQNRSREQGRIIT
jgi:hypothetical protein